MTTTMTTNTLIPTLVRSHSVGSQGPVCDGDWSPRARPTALPKDRPPTSLNTFWAKHPEFLVGPATIAAVLLAVWRDTRVDALCQQHEIVAWGSGALRYVVFSILLQFAFHGFMCCFETALNENKFQPTAQFQHAPAVAATRQTAVLLTNLIYALVPLRPPSTSWPAFLGTMLAFALAWDAYFFVMHRAFHKDPRLYKLVHKLHHQIHQPNAFTAYFVTYQSHLLTEQFVVFYASILGLPSDVLLVFLYASLVDTFVQHCGVEVDHLQLPLLPFLTVGHVRGLLSLHQAPFGAMSTAHHDWHHEKNGKNYALCFTYLDRLFGSFHPGREPERACFDLGERALGPGRGAGWRAL